MRDTIYMKQFCNELGYGYGTGYGHLGKKAGVWDSVFGVVGDHVGGGYDAIDWCDARSIHCGNHSNTKGDRTKGQAQREKESPKKKESGGRIGANKIFNHRHGGSVTGFAVFVLGYEYIKIFQYEF